MLFRSEVEKLEAEDTAPVPVVAGAVSPATATTGAETPVADASIPALVADTAVPLVAVAPIAPAPAELKEKRAKKEKAARACPHCNAVLPEIKLLKPTGFTRDKENMLPTDVRDWLASIKDDDLRKLCFDPLYSRPELMIMTVLPVPPVNVRPSITLETGERSEDDLTHKLVDIIRINQKLEANINAGAPQLII